MGVIFEARAAAEEYTVEAGDTLETIAAAKGRGLGWKMLARYNWGTDEPKEVRRALCETVGVKVADLAKIGLAGSPEKLGLQPDADLAPKLKIPQPWKKEGLEAEKTHTVKVERLRPANAVEIMELDKWFIPDLEKCAVEYELHGDGDRANTLHFEIFGNKYCDATKWSDGVGTWSDPAALIDVPIYTKHLTAPVAERTTAGLPDDGWKGEANTKRGMLGRKTGKEEKRFINVAFSPYTVHLRYYKARADEKAHLLLEPFWPHWEAVKTEPAPTVTPGGSIAIAWSNAEKADFGAIEVLDAAGQRVWHHVLEDEKLKKGARQVQWDGGYLKGTINGKFESRWMSTADDGKPLTELLFKSTPYVYKVYTFKHKKKDDSLKLKWEVRHTSKLDEGVIEITDGKGKVVFLKPLAKAKLAEKKHEFTWNGKYPEGVKNSEDGDEIIPKDMPYRVQIRAHTKMTTAEGLALAAMHTEVRLYVHKSAYRPKDLRYEAASSDPCALLSKAPFVPGDPPEKGSGTEWFRYQLAQCGFHSGPVKAGNAAQSAYQAAMREFKRSVPADGSVAAPNFTRLNLANGDDVAENGATETALETIRASDKRGMFGNPDRVAGNDENPDFNDDDANAHLRDREKDMIVWVDDRQYYTREAAKDDNNDPFLSGTDARSTFGMLDYRGEMTKTDDAKSGLDTGAIPRPWIPVKAEFSLLGREDDLYPDYALAKVKIDDADRRKKISRAIGPLPVHWSFDELPMDVSGINPAAYSKDTSRSRKYVAWSIHQSRADHTRKDTGRKHWYTNCSETHGGLRPSSLASYYEKAFGTDALSLDPWKAKAVSATESVATVVHDHICSDQKDKHDAASENEKQTLFEALIGAAGAYFRPSIIAGDGYRVRAEMKFKKFSGYEFPNLEALRQRYPVRPHAHAASLRVWRRSSFRGYMCWGTATGNWPGHAGGFRDRYKPAHVYFVHEGGAAQTFNITNVFDPSQDAHKTRYKNIIKNNEPGETWHQEVSRIDLRSADLWPWGHRSDLGWRKPSPVNTAFGELYDKWESPHIISSTWRKFRSGLLIALVKEIEKRGYLRGHLFVEFTASPAAVAAAFQCNGTTSHKYYYVNKAGGAHWKPNGEDCPAPGCVDGTGAPGKLTATGSGKVYSTGFPLPAVGVALGATWLFKSDAETWAHEVGHHRHLEHASSAPGAEATLHDSEQNSTQAWPASVTDAKNKQWDRKCIMSYENMPDLCFCGRCLLRNRGWKITALGFPGAGVKEP